MIEEFILRKVDGGVILRVYRHFKVAGRCLLIIREKLILSKLWKRYSHIIISNDNSHASNLIGKDTKVWVLWWQGKSEIPELINRCIDSISIGFPNREIVIVDKNNYYEYVDIPEYIINKLEAGKITITAFSDVLRMALLSKHGGIWCDATLFFTDIFPEDISEKFFWTIKHAPCKPQIELEPSRAYWRAFFLATGRDNLITKSCYDLYLEYFKENDSLIDYFQVDFFIKLCYLHSDFSKRMIDSVKEIPPSIYELYDSLSLPYSQELQQKINKLYPVHKLNRRGSFEKNTSTGSQTFYSVFINSEG